MKNGKLVYYYIASSLAILVPIPGRFAFGLIEMILFNIQMLTIAVVFHSIAHLNLSHLKNSILTLALIAVTVMYKQLLIIICPIAALTLGFCIYLPALTTVVIEFFFAEYEKGIKEHLKNIMAKSLPMTVFCIIYFLLRDIIGYGTITLPSWKKLFVLRLFNENNSVSASTFMATIPGSLVFIALLLCIYLIYDKKRTILKSSPVFKGEE